MKQKVSPVVALVVIIAVVAIALRFGWKSLGPQHEEVQKPFDMGKMMKDKMSPPKQGASPMSPTPGGAR